MATIFVPPCPAVPIRGYSSYLCTRGSLEWGGKRERLSRMTPDSPLLDLVDLATRAPSGHNAQPWTIVRREGQRLVLRSEPHRWLRMIDPTNRDCCCRSER